MSSYSHLYQKLNTAQKQAVDTIEGPVMVIAGPGTGKTQILTLRIANILQKTDTPPSGILALTFTEAGVFAMRKRLVEIIGSRGYQVHIFTFHGFCNELIRTYPDEFPRIIGSSNITDVDKMQIIRDCINATELKRLKPFGDPLYYLKPLSKAISDLKRENISPKEACKRVKKQRKDFDAVPDKVHEKGAHKGKVKGEYVDREKKIEKNEELCVLYEKYEAALRERKLYDYEDMIVETIRALQSSEAFLLQVQEEYLYVLADEHQDANNSQNTLLELLASFHENPNLFLVGDAKQAIYRFQGASLENFLYFKDRYPQAELVQLEDNYRSRQAILDSSYSLIAQGDLSEYELRQPLTAHLEGKDEKIAIASFSHPEYEALYLARSLRDLLDQGIPANEIAVLYRNNSDAQALVPMLERANISFVIESDQNILDDHRIQNFVALLKAVQDYGNDEKLASVLFAPFLGLHTLDVYKLLKGRRTTRERLYALLGSKKKLEECGIESVDTCIALSKKLVLWHQVSREQGVLSVLDRIADESGFLASIIERDDSREELGRYRALVRDAEGLVAINRRATLEDFVEHLVLLDDYKLSVSSARSQTQTSAVRLMTAHRSKGLEFDYVFITQGYDTHWGNKRSIEHFSIPLTDVPQLADSMADERRLFYVALTRARHGVTILYSRDGETGRQQLASQFIEEIDEVYRDQLDTESFEASVDPKTFVAPRIAHSASVADTEYLKELFLEQGLSVTALNAYLKDPWQYFFESLLRLPRASATHLLFGTAVHAALKDLFDLIRDEKPHDSDLLVSRFREHCDRLPFAEAVFADVLKKGEIALAGYYTARSERLTSTLATELSIVVNFPLGNGMSIPLRGVLDRLEECEGGVHVVDYKTGKPKTRNHIEGKTKAEGAGDYKRQLVFYKLLLSLYEEGRYTMVSGEVDFIEPDEKGRYHSETFDITDADVEQLKKEIIQSAQEIYDLSFWGHACDGKTCDYCSLVSSLQKAEH